jgi:hypothetical protein
MRVISRVVRLFGFGIFVLAFFLPAVAPPGASTGPGSGPQPGWVCAGFTLIPSGALFQHPAALLRGTDAKEYMLLFSGWVNPLILIYLLFCLGRRWRWPRRIAAVAIVICLACAWMFLAREHFTALIGHYLWVAGTLLMLAPELMPLVRTEAAVAASA